MFNEIHELYLQIVSTSRLKRLNNLNIFLHDKHGIMK